MKLTEEKTLLQLVAALENGSQGLRELFYQLGFDYDKGVLPLPSLPLLRQELCQPPQRIARCSEGEVCLVWFPLAVLSMRLEARLCQYYRTRFSYAVFLFSDATFRHWEICCPTGAEDSSEQGKARFLRFDLRNLTAISLRAIFHLQFAAQEAIASEAYQYFLDAFKGGSCLHTSQGNDIGENTGAQFDKSEKTNTTNVVAWWLSVVGKYRMLTADEEKRVSCRIRTGDIAAREVLINANLRLVVSNAKRYLWSGMPISDLTQAGNLGLIHAVDHFDPDLGNRFSTYATHWIRQAIGRCIENEARLIRLPAHIEEKLNRIARATTQIENMTGKDASCEEIMTMTGIEANRISDICSVPQHVLSLNWNILDKGATELLSLIDNRDEAQNPLNQVIRWEQYAIAEQLISQLTEREQIVVRRRIGMDGNDKAGLQEIADEVGLSRERVRQIELLVVNKLRKAALQTEIIHASVQETAPVKKRRGRPCRNAQPLSLGKNTPQ